MTGATILGVQDYLRHIDRSARALGAYAGEAGPDARVPTCPDWTVADLVGHQGMVHRWATAVVAGALPSTDLDAAAQAATVPPTDPAAVLAWYAEGFPALLAALRAAPDDLAAAVFLHAAPPPRVFWARRQAHETTIHCVDALSATHGRRPTAAEAAVETAFAADGIDELLVGFVGRRSSRLRSDTPLTLLVAPSDTDVTWRVSISTDPPVVTRGADIGSPADAVNPGDSDAVGSGRPADAVLTGTAAALYLGLWNRGDEIVATGDPGVLDLWRRAVQVTWG